MTNSNPIIRGLYIVGGTLSVILGFIGIVVPLLPTVPFLLLAAYCYAKGSEKFYKWFVTNRLFGRMITDYKEGRGVPLWTKIASISFLWCIMGYSLIYRVENTTVKLVMILVGVAVTIHLMMLKSHRS